LGYNPQVEVVMMRFGMVLVLGLGCTSEDKLSVRNAIPVALITSHTGVEAVREGDLITVIGAVSDDTDAPSTLSVTWYSGDAPVCAPSPPLDDGITICEVEVPAGEEFKIRLEVRDPKNALGEDKVTLEITANQAPEVALSAPTTEETYVVGELIEFVATVTDLEDAPEDLGLWFESSLDGRIDLTVTPTSDGEIAGSILLTEGSHNLALWAQDTVGHTNSDSVVITVGPPNTGPTCEITQPESGTAVALWDLVVFEATASDVDVPSDWLTASWQSDEDDVLGDSAPSSAGEIAFPIDTLSANTHIITLTVTDEIGATCTDFILLTVSTPPVVLVTAPLDGATANEGDPITFAATVTDEEDPAASLIVDWNSSLDGSLSSGPPDSSGNSTFISSALSAGTHLMSITVTDTDGFFATAVQVLNVNGAPSAPEVAISPVDPQTADGLSVAISSASIDPDGDSVSYTYSWLRDGVDTAETATAVDASATAKDQVWTVVVTPTDGSITGDAGSASVTIGNTAPVLDGVAVAPSDPSAADTLSCVVGTATDADGDGVTLTYAWSINGDDAGVSAASLSGSFEAGDSVSCTATPSDGTDFGSAVVSDAVVILNAAPSIETVTISPDSAVVGDTLSCGWSGYVDPDGDPDSSSIAWEINGVSAGSGAVLSTGFVGADEVTCTVTPFDGTDAGTPVSATLVIGNTAPVVGLVTIGPDPAVVGDTLACSWSGYVDPDGDLDSSSIAWEINGVSAGSGAMLSTGFVGADEVTCTVTPFDGTDAGTPVSATLVIGNTPPAVGPVSIIPASGVTLNSALTCTATASDVDGGTPTLSYAWDADGTTLGIGGSVDLSGTGTTKGQDVTCTATATDLSGDTSIGSASVTVGNTAPEIVGASIESSAAQTNDVLSVVVTTLDADDDTVGLSYTWYVGTSVAGTSSTLNGATAFDKYDEVYVVVTPTDGEDEGDPVATDSITIENTPPSALVVSIDEGGGGLICLIDAESTDDDGDTIDYTFDWDVDGTPFTDTDTSTHTGDTISEASLSSDETWTCTVTPDDGDATGPTATASVTVVSLDSDGDGVLDVDDVCPGFDDTVDTNDNGVPDGCESFEVFDYTGSVQIFDVPSGATSVFIEAEGAKGWSGSHPGGEGGFSSGTLVVSPGDELYVYVGGQGTVSPPSYTPSGAGWNGGGLGQTNTGASSVGGGGGASDVRLIYSTDPVNLVSLESRVLVAAGGGGATNNGTAYGGDGGGSIGEDGGQHAAYHYGRGGTQSSGGSSGGGFGQGGDAEGWMTPWNGGGGGGWYGGGVSEAHSGGGGGSSYIGGVDDGIMERGGNNGDGLVVIYWAESP
jgi:hypothetical protein